ncbi:META domain-containing protein [Deinococcus taeanensis]|uniref:META domain-containing protein n=1 Tax=Deinococcus taeanensis TaxID=2737050 RepID=UPI001CDCDA07|nr:META domain-containing protein [Deinococcus taeanensis]UBV43260.1 META domain-containing protein [Deinococcus taeanensis]
MSALLSALTFAALAAPASSASPVGVTWTLQVIQPAGQAPITPGARLTRPTLRLDGTGSRLTVTGTTGCSALNAQAALNGQALVLRAVQGGTSERCADAALSLRGDYLHLLNTTTRYALKSGTLTLSGAAGQLTFTAGGAMPQPVPSPALLNGTWLARSLRGPAGPERTTALLRLSVQGARVTLGGLAGCNTVSATGAVLDGPQVQFGVVTATRRVCPGAAGEAETRLLSLLRGPLSATVQGDTLLLRGATGQLTLTRAPAVITPGAGQPDPDRTYTLTRLNGQPAPQTPRPVTLTFQAGRVGGSDGCNSVGAAYVLQGGRVTLSEPVVSTRMACPEGLSVNLAGLLEQRPALGVQGAVLTLRAGEEVWEFQAR